MADGNHIAASSGFCETTRPVSPDQPPLREWVWTYLASSNVFMTATTTDTKYNTTADYTQRSVSWTLRKGRSARWFARDGRRVSQKDSDAADSLQSAVEETRPVAVTSGRLFCTVIGRYRRRRTHPPDFLHRLSRHTSTSRIVWIVWIVHTYILRDQRTDSSINRFQSAWRRPRTIYLPSTSIAMSADLFAEFGAPAAPRHATGEPESSTPTGGNGRPGTVSTRAVEDRSSHPGNPSGGLSSTAPRETLFDAGREYPHALAKKHSRTGDAGAALQSSPVDLLGDSLAPLTISMGDSSVSSGSVRIGYRKDINGLAKSTAATKISRGRSPVPQQDENIAKGGGQLQDHADGWDDDWDDFDETPTSRASKHPSVASTVAITSRSVPQQKNRPATSRASDSQADPSRVRPTNIPPPSILLALFPSLLEELHNAITTHSTTPSHPHESSCHQIPTVLKTLYRILVGRTLRWKRDTILRQSTSISAARPGGKTGGMKLTSVNKHESANEDRETVDVIAAYRRHGAALNTASAGSPVIVPPDPTPVAHVRTAGAGEGVLRAAHACPLCGLRRDERIVRMDDEVYDSFGEWWVEHWGHTDCKRFWEAYEGRLERR